MNSRVPSYRLSLLVVLAALSACATSNRQPTAISAAYTAALNEQVRRTLEAFPNDVRTKIDSQRSRSDGDIYYLFAAIVAVARYDHERQGLFDEAISAMGAGFLDGPAPPGRRMDAEQVIAASLRWLHGCMDLGVFCNPLVSPENPAFLLTLTGETARPGPDAQRALELLFGESVNPRQLRVSVIQGARTKYAGITVDDIAVVNQTSVRKSADILRLHEATVAEVVIANEATHLLLNRRFARHTGEWPTAAIRRVMGVSFTPTQQQVSEFLSDVVSVNTHNAGIEFALSNLLGGARQQGGAPNPRHRYALSSEFFLLAFDRAETAAKLPASIRRAARLRELAGTVSADELNKRITAVAPGRAQYAYIANEYLTIGRQVLRLITPARRDDLTE